MELMEVPGIIQDPNSMRRFEKGRLLGKGSFAKCHELKDLATGELVAGKIVRKSMPMHRMICQVGKMSQVGTVPW